MSSIYCTTPEETGIRRNAWISRLQKMLFSQNSSTGKIHFQSHLILKVQIQPQTNHDGASAILWWLFSLLNTGSDTKTWSHHTVTRVNSFTVRVTPPVWMHFKPWNFANIYSHLYPMLKEWKGYNPTNHSRFFDIYSPPSWTWPQVTWP